MMMVEDFIENPRNRQIYELRLEGKNYREIGERVGLSTGRAQSIFLRYIYIVGIEGKRLDDYMAFMSEKSAKRLIRGGVSLRRAKDMTVEELKRVNRISKETAEEIYAGLHGGIND